MIFGVRAVMEAIDAGKVLDKVLVRRDMSSAIGRELLIKLDGTGTQIQRVPLEKLNQFTDKNHQGVIAFLSPIEFTPLDSLVQSLYDEGKVPLLVMLDRTYLRMRGCSRADNRYARQCGYQRRCGQGICGCAAFFAYL